MKPYPPLPTFPYEYMLEVPNDSITLRFNSKFESGNLYKAIKLSDYEYLLYINNDIGSYNQNHWFYFSVTNPRKTSITLKIVNLRKKDAHYMTGMMPAVYSSKGFREHGTKWHRDGFNITYTENLPTNPTSFVGRLKYYTLSFTYTFKYEGDEVFFAYAVPYTYSELVQQLEIINNEHSDIAVVAPLCSTIAGNICYKITITENIAEYTRERRPRKKGEKVVDKFKKRKGIVLMARTHSGETVSSHMMKGAIDYLLSPLARNLLKNYVFKIVPMLNPDGVRYGNYRTSLLGVDLNRRWKEPNKILHPTVYSAKNMIQEFKERHQIMMVCDMHGHTKKKDVFIYGCSVKSPETIDRERNLLARVIPYQLSKRNSFFSFPDSHFRIEKGKESTARIVLFQEFEIVHSYTMEASFFGPSRAESFGSAFEGDMHFTTKDLGSLGQDLCKCCLTFNSQRIYSRKIRQTNTYLRSTQLKAVASEEPDEEIVSDEVEPIVREHACDDLEVIDVGADPESSGSDSEPSDDESNNYSYQQKKKSKTLEVPVKVEKSPCRTPSSSIKPLTVKKQKIMESDWSMRRTARSPAMPIFSKPQETISPQNFHFPLQSKFNPFALEIKNKSEIPELDTQKKIPKISKSQKRPPVVYATKPKNTELYLPALLNVNLPDAQTLFSRSTRRQKHSDVYSDAEPPIREVMHIGSSSFNGF